MPDIPRLEGESLLEYARRRAKLEGIEVPPPPAPKEEPPPQEKYYDPDLVPDDPTPEQFKRERAEIDAILGRIDIVEAYNLYCRKMHVDPKGKTSNIMVSCPIPGHEDKVPSADLNLNKGDGGVWHCHKCQQGGDKYDLAAWFYGFDVPGYKDGKNFPDLKRRMAEGRGWTLMVSGKEQWLEKIVPVETAIAKSQSEDAPPPTVIDITPVVNLQISPLKPESVNSDDYRQINHPGELDWRTLPCITSGTFLHTWMTETSRAHQPEEFYLFEGFAALGLAVGHRVLLDDEDRVRPNTMICLVGGTGTGKSRSVGKFNQLIREALPFQEMTAGGVKFIHSPGSGEDLVNQMIYYTTDPVTKEVTYYPVRALFYEDEFEALMGKINKVHSTLRSNLMKFFDSSQPVAKSSQTHGAAISRDHFMQVLTTTQPKRLGALLSSGDATSGFLNRWLFVFGTEKYRPSFSDVRLDLKPSAEKLSQIRAWSSQGHLDPKSPGRLVHLDADPDVLDNWDGFVQELIRPLEATDNLLVARIELQCKKLLLLMAINDRSTMITIQHMESLRLMFPFIKHSYGIIEKNVGHTLVDECVSAIEIYFASHPDEDISMRMIQKQSGARKYEMSVVVRAMEVLVKANTIFEVPRPVSAKVARWRYTPDADPDLQLAPVVPIRQNS